MTKSQIHQLEKRIEKLLEKLVRIGPMRPGSISKQDRDRENQKGVYYQLSYTHKMRSRTEHVWPEHLKELRAENAEYKKFKQLTGELIDLSIELSKGKIARLRNQSADS
jgi:hypothetical protein